MNEKQRKDDFIKCLNIKLKNRALLRETAINILIDVINKFNGKVYNKRFENALNEALKNNSDNLRASFTRDYQRRREGNIIYSDCYIKISLIAQNEKYNYNNYENLIITIKLNAERINADNVTLSGLESFDNYTAEIEKTVNNYDAFIKVAQNVQKAINDFANLPFYFRENINFSCKFYLS